MKELSIEEKAHRYDEAIEIAKKINNEHKAQPFDVMLKVFPELAESEDEKIRKVIKKALQVRCDGSRIISDEPVTLEEAIAWLEKQGEQKSVDDLTPQEAMDIAVAKCFEEGEQKPANKVEPKFKVGDKIQYSKGCGTIMTIEKIENGEYIFANNMGHTTIEWGNKWYLVELKPTWNEEDERIYKSITYSFAHNYPLTVQQQEFIKFLKERYTWKPSDEQMKQLKRYCPDNRPLTSLYEQLKKLRGE